MLCIYQLLVQLTGFPDQRFHCRVLSTLGAVETRYDRTGADGVTEIFIPVFEGKAIYVYSFRADGEPVECLPDGTLGCTECGSPPGPP